MRRRAALRVIAAALLVTACDRSDEVASTPVDTTPTATGATVPGTTPPITPLITPPISPPTTSPTTATASSAPPTTATDVTTSPAAAPPPTRPDCLEPMSARAKLGLLVWPAVYSRSWDAAIAVVRDVGVGGVVLMEPSGWSVDDVGDRLAELDAVAANGLVVAIDEEGGDVQRLRVLGELPSQQTVSEQYALDDVRPLIAEHAARLRAVGIDVVFAPVVDVVPTDGVVPLSRSRFFTGDASVVTDEAREYVEAWMEHGILPVLKHFPGHGSASADTHLAAAVTDPIDQLAVSDVVPYRELAGTGAGVMVGHLIVPGLTEGLPASRSRAALDLLRTTLGYGDALVVSDALGMGGVGVDVEQAAIDAIGAGIDVVVFSGTEQAGPVIDSLVEEVAAGRLSMERVDASARRVLRLGGAAHLGCDPS